MTLVKDEDAACALAAAFLEELGQSSDVVIDALMVLLRDDDAAVRALATAALGESGQSSDVVIDALMVLLRDDDAAVRALAAAALGWLEQSLDVVINADALVVLLRDDSAAVRSATAASLGKLSQSSDAVIETLLDLLKDDARGFAGKVSDRATESLTTLAKKSDTVKPALVQWIEQHQHEAYVSNGIDALWEIASQLVILRG